MTLKGLKRLEQQVLADNRITSQEAQKLISETQDRHCVSKVEDLRSAGSMSAEG